MPRADLLDYLQRYRATPRRRLWRVERWRRRGWDRGTIASQADALAARLHAAGVGPGDRAGIYAKDGSVWAAALFGVLRSGAVAVPVDIAHPPDLVARLASRLNLRAWLADTELPRLDLEMPQLEVGWGRCPSTGEMPPMPAEEVDRVAEVVLTSGTTDLPQSVEVSHENIRAVLDSLEAEISKYRWLIRLAPRLRLVVTLPLSHLYGQFMGVLLPVALDADVAVVDTTMPAAELARALRRERAWVLASVPHTLSSLLEHLLGEGRRAWGEAGLERRLEKATTLSWSRRCRLFGHLRRRLGRRLVAVVSGGASLDAEVERLWKLLGYVVIQGYGLTEAAPLVTVNHPFHARQGSVGTPLPGVEVRVATNGEILVRGRNVATPSSRGPRIDAKGWLHTGDLGELLHDGSIRIRGRISDRIVTPAGVNVEPGEVTVALRAAEQVVDAAVVEQPWGEPGTLCAVLVVYPGTDVAAVVRRANRGLADAARVRSWFVWPTGDLPRTPTGKVRRGELIAWLEGQAPSGERGDQAAHGRGADSSHAALGAGGRDRVDGVLGAIVDVGDEVHGLPNDTPIGELLSSLERVELAARLEDLYGISSADALFAGEPTVADVAATVRAAAGIASRAGWPRAPTAASGRGLEAVVDRGAAASEAPAAAGHDRDGAIGVVARPTRKPPDAALWRYRLAARAARFVLRECIMHPLARLLVRIDVESAVPIADLGGPFLLAANHTSAVDPMVMFALPPRLRGRLAPAARWNFFASHRRGARLYFWSVLGLNVFPLVQSGDWRPTLRVGGELADRGHSILIYPEGAISEDGEIHAFKKGVAVMSRDLHLPVVPCATAGLERLFPPGSRRLRDLSRTRPVMGVCIGEPIPAARPDDDLDLLVGALEASVRRLHERARAMAGTKRRGPCADPSRYG